MRHYEIRPGQHIKDAASEMVRFATMLGEPIKAKFNDVELIARANQKPEEIVSHFNAECERRHLEWINSPEGKEAERRAAESRAIAAEAEAEGILDFSVSDQESWDKTVAANTDPYGAGAVRFAARWANYMEHQLALGKSLSDIAKDTSREADKEGITGFMYGCAISILSQVWKHGEELRRWHNLDTQLGKEGEVANDRGGVLNPAILRIG